MKTLFAAALLFMVCAGPAFAQQRPVPHPKGVHPQNPYLKHQHKKHHSHHHKA
jgi:hypothetical protein